MLVRLRHHGGPMDTTCTRLFLANILEQEAVAPCPVNGTCEAPLGTTTVGLIYGEHVPPAVELPFWV